MIGLAWTLDFGWHTWIGLVGAAVSEDRLIFWKVSGKMVSQAIYYLEGSWSWQSSFNYSGLCWLRAAGYLQSNNSCFLVSRLQDHVLIVLPPPQDWEVPCILNHLQEVCLITSSINSMASVYQNTMNGYTRPWKIPGIFLGRNLIWVVRTPPTILSSRQSPFELFHSQNQLCGQFHSFYRQLLAPEINRLDKIHNQGTNPEKKCSNNFNSRTAPERHCLDNSWTSTPNPMMGE